MSDLSTLQPSADLFRDFTRRITIAENDDEIRSIAYLVFEHLFRLSSSAILSNKSLTITRAQQMEMDAIVERLNTHEPVQYILGHAYFYNRKFDVNSVVLIPRPETEELVAMIINKYSQNSPRMLDIGTGSGCIPITLALEIKNAAVFATDISTNALDTAKKNADDLHATVTFTLHDILSAEIPYSLLDCIVSNPPYIPIKELSTLQKNVVSYEPHLALFVPDSDPYLFYQKIIDKSTRALKKDGMLFVEIHEGGGSSVRDLFRASGFTRIEVTKDMSGKDRIVSGVLI